MDGAARLPSSTFDPETTFPLAAKGEDTGIVAVDRHGTLLLARHPSSRDELMPVSTLFLKKKNGEDERIPSPRRTRRQQTLGGAMDDDWVVWMETGTGGIDVWPWLLYAYDRRAHRTFELARSPMVDGHAPLPPPGYTGPTLSNGRVSWVQVGGHEGAERVDVYSCVVAHCVPRRVAERAAFPVAQGDLLHYIDYASRRVNGEATTPSTMHVRSIDLATGKRQTIASVPLESDQVPAGLAVGAERAVWIINGATSFAVVRDLSTGQSELIRARDDGGEFGYPVAGDDFVAWAESSGTSPANVGGYVVLADGRLYSIGNKSGLYGIEASGRHLVWQDQRRVDGDGQLAGITWSMAAVR